MSRVARRLVDELPEYATWTDFARLVIERQRVEEGIADLVEAPYRIVYRLRRQAVEVIEVFHSAQLPPWER